MRILIADDHAVVRRGLRQILADDFKKADFGEVGTAREALDRIRKENWDAVILDITMPGRNGQETAIEDGKYKDGEVSFQVTRERQGNKFTIKYTGKVSGDTIKGKIETTRDGNAAGQPRDWEAKREKADKA